MDIGELMKFKPATAPKRPAAEEDPEGRGHDSDDPDANSSYDGRASKRRRQQKGDRRLSRREEEERLAALEKEAASVSKGESRGMVEGDTDGGISLDEASMKKLILDFEKKALRNQELRVKHPDEPTRFMASEVDLHESVERLRDLAAAPHLYPLLVELRCVPSFLGLLAHENADISVAVVELLQELTDPDVLQEAPDSAEALVKVLLEAQALALLVQNLERLDDNVKEEAEGIHSSLGIIENLVELEPKVCLEVAKGGLLSWLLRRLKVKVPFDNNKLYAAEILSILLHSEPENRKSLGETSGAMDSLLQQLAYYKRHDPTSAEEGELMENLFDCICSLLLHFPNRERFLRGEGLQLMNLMLREKKASRTGALKVLNHALDGSEGKDCCAKFVDILGLRTIFPLLMKTPSRKHRRGVSAEEHEEHTVGIVASLLKNCREPHKQRVLAKFTERDHEKIERVMELHFKYFDRVRAVEAKLAAEDIDEDGVYLKLLDAGLFTLQLVDYIVAEVCSGSAAGAVKQRVLQILAQRKGSVQDIREVLREYAGNLGGGDDDDENSRHTKEQDRQRILQLVDKF